MYQNYNYYPQQQPQNYLRQAPTQQQSILKGRLVSSLDEVRASPVDFDGSISYFPDLGNKLIYTKQINPDGTATLCIYERKELPTMNGAPMDGYISREEFEKVIAQLRQELAQAPAAKETLKSF